MHIQVLKFVWCIRRINESDAFYSTRNAADGPKRYSYLREKCEILVLLREQIGFDFLADELALVFL